MIRECSQFSDKTVASQNRRMCREYTWVIAVASAFGLVQSVIWTGAALVSVLVYYCVVTVPDYKDKTDFFVVTLVKLYFEGPGCIPDGSYLGKFNKDYRNSIRLLGRDVMMFGMVAYIVLNIVYFFLSIGLYRKRHQRKKRFHAVGWSAITFVFCALDALMTFALVYDAFVLMDYMHKNPDINDTLLGGIPYIPILLAFVSSRFIVIWMWNFFSALHIFFVGLCGWSSAASPRAVAEPIPQSVAKAEEKPVEKPETKPRNVEETKEPEEDASINLISRNFKTEFPEYLAHAEYTRSMEAVTRFPSDEQPCRESHCRAWCYAPPVEQSHHPKYHSNVKWEATNEGYVNDEHMARELDRNPDFDHDLKNFESGQRKIKVAKLPVGKPVSVPVPPPLPSQGSCNC